MEALTYLLEVNLYISAFYGFYRLALHGQTFYSLNRLYLLSTVMFSFVLPFFQAGRLPALLSGQQDVATYMILDAPVAAASTENGWYDGWSGQALWLVYMAGLCLFAVKLILSLYKIAQLGRNKRNCYRKGVRIVELDDTKHPGFSFFNTLFISAQAPNRETIIRHELVHIRRKHSYDVVFFECVRIACWFNPCVYLLCRDMRLLHEFEADERTAPSDKRYDYALFLIKSTYGLPDFQLTNHIFNQSILKRRINMLNKKQSSGSARFRYLLAVPIGLSLLVVSTTAFTNAGYKKVDLAPAEPMKIRMMSQDTVKTIRLSGPNQPGRKNFFINYVKGADGKPHPTDKRLIVLNGKPLKTGETGGVINASQVQTLSAAEATRRFGDKGQYGAVVISGENARVLGYPVAPPPAPAPPAKSKMRFPPPPPAEPKSAAQGRTVRFPAPKAGPESKSKPLPPPPPAAPAPPKSVDFDAAKVDAGQLTDPEFRAKTIASQDQAPRYSITITPAEAKARREAANNTAQVEKASADQPARSQSTLKEVVIVGHGAGGPGAKPAKAVRPRSQSDLKPVTVTGYSGKN
ncbi:hypothetical protein C7T94_17430 [Pedobacter yulinensis]|uniref:Peptidase M56 domain-containing protein n=1 Tax=Pedobacter yulinensis TaxID=2126353 RepID=A0A2T3HHP7_9SPHI|nr:M56 family metallopeptidase [Pedobacter yulinensis]PST81968.1 hypothetical protein C7T94_17430 [Pedobacter yulinensis]